MSAVVGSERGMRGSKSVPRHNRRSEGEAVVDTKLQSLNQQGYVVIPDVLPPDTCEHFKTILEEAHAAYSGHYADNASAGHRLNFHCDEKIVYNLHNKHPDLLPLIDHPAVFDIVEPFLQQGSYGDSDPVILRQNTARCPLRGKAPQQLHIDSRLPGLRFPLMAVVTWMLDDFTEENGATRLVPGSQHYPNFPADGKIYPDEITTCGRQGSVVIMDGGVWHGSGENHTDGTRWVILMTYVRWFYRSAFDFNRNMPAEHYALLTERQKQIMGYTVNPPIDEFTRISARSDVPDPPEPYELPHGG